MGGPGELILGECVCQRLQELIGMCFNNFVTILKIMVVAKILGYYGLYATMGSGLHKSDKC